MQGHGFPLPDTAFSDVIRSGGHQIELFQDQSKRKVIPGFRATLKKDVH